jgi:hypothetical protein
MLKASDGKRHSPDKTDSQQEALRAAREGSKAAERDVHHTLPFPLTSLFWLASQSTCRMTFVISDYATHSLCTTDAKGEV